MATADNTYSRLIAWLKIILPLLSLAILSTLFLVAETLDPEKAIPYADVDVAEILREQRIGKPAFAGVTSDGTAITVAAGEAKPDPNDTARLTGTDLVAQLLLPQGAMINITSPRGVIDGTAREAVLEGGARLETSTGYKVQTARLTTSFESTYAMTDGVVTADGPPGDISAGLMELTEDTENAGQYLLVFKNGVKLIYDPQP